MKTLNKPLFFLTLALAVLAVLVELGGPVVIPQPKVTPDQVDVVMDTSALSPAQLVELNQISSGEKPPGHGVRSLAAVDGILLFSLGLMAAGLLVGEYVQARAQGIISLVVMLSLLGGLIVWLFAVIGNLIVMLALLMAFPFGPLVYLAIYGFFPRGAAAGILGLLMALKSGMGVSLVAAHPGFLQNISLVLIIATSLAATALVSLLHGLVPGILVSITDAIAAIIVIILGLVWAIYLLVTSVSSLVKLLRT